MHVHGSLLHGIEPDSKCVEHVGLVESLSGFVEETLRHGELDGLHLLWAPTECQTDSLIEGVKKVAHP
jgi:hypothetical protein